LKEAKKKLEDEIRTLDRELKEEIPKALKTAAAMGDLSENAEYQKN
jgi:transcription elongation factor GreA